MNTTTKRVWESTQEVAAQIINETLSRAELIAKDMIERVDQELTNLKNPQVAILEVKLDDLPAQKLSSPAVPFLKRIIINSKLGLNSLPAF